VSSAEHFVRHHKRQTNLAISQAYSRLAMNSSASATFTELLHCVRQRAAGLFAAPLVNGHHPGVEALVNLSRFERAHVRPHSTWPGCDASWQGAAGALAQHLTTKHRVPRFLAAAWYAADASGDAKRSWYIAHAAGASFRSLDLPMAMTRAMEHIFLSSHDHFEIEYAMRRAELIGLSAPLELAEAVLATRVGSDLRNADFWRTVWLFLITNAHAINPAHVGPIIDFIQAIRHERIAVETREGIVMREPPLPSFSIKGRTAQSVLRLMQDWHRSLGVVHGGLTWSPSPLRPMAIEEPSQEPSAPPAIWEVMELTNGAQLRAEGSALHHCVASYADRCWRGSSRIWSLRVRRGEKTRPVLTIEVDMKTRAVVQARGWSNRPASGKPLRLLHDWTVKERLRLVL
jgi:hypothetical protein